MIDDRCHTCGERVNLAAHCCEGVPVDAAERIRSLRAELDHIYRVHDDALRLWRETITQHIALEAHIETLAEKWDAEAKAYPDTADGFRARAFLHYCTRDLRAALAAESP